MSTAAGAASDTTSSRPSFSVPNIDDVAGVWVDAADLVHLPSLRNQYGQAHVNHDLTSMSWLAAPPYTFGYHTGVLRVNGTVPTTHRYLWKPWGVTREHAGETLTIRTDTRMAYKSDQLMWRIEITNTATSAQTVTLSQDLFAMVAHTEIGWGWLYDVPWSSDNYHDFMTLERIRATTKADTDGPYMLGPGRRLLRLGKPRLPGIQRDGDTTVMDLATELPRHVTPDTIYPYDRGARVTVRALTFGQAFDGEWMLRPDDEVILDPVALTAGQTISFQVRPDSPDDTGVILTHGNHPDSLQIGLDSGRLWFAIAGEKEYAARDLTPGAWHTITVQVTADQATLHVDGRPAGQTSHWTMSPRWKSVSDGNLVTVCDSRSPAQACYAFGVMPDRIDERGAGAQATWTLELPPGGSRTVEIACAYGSDNSVTDTAAGVAATFAMAFQRSEQGYRDLWQAAFTPGNDEFSGHLPTFVPDDPGVGRAYYMGALLALYMRNVRVSRTEPIFLTGGPRLGATTTYFWDHTEWSRLYAMLEPQGLRSWLLRALASPLDSCFGFDTRSGGPLGNKYVSNEYSLFRLIEHYVAVTGDTAFLAEEAGQRTVLEHLTAFAYGWRDKRTAATGGTLADFGPDPWMLLECVPEYVNVVASFNAAYVGMMRAYAGLCRSLGDDATAATAEAEAAELAAGVIDLAMPGGRWAIRHPDRIDTIGHCLDFGLVASYLHADLDDDRRHAMVDFVTSKLLDSTWMRALALDDPAAPNANRSDHGAAGAFGAWPGVTAHGLAKLGRLDLAARLLSVVPDAASGGLWGQAQEIVTDARGDRVRVAEVGASNRDAIAGVGIAEAVVSGLFDVEPSFRSLDADHRHTRHVPGIGTLTNLNIQ